MNLFLFGLSLLLVVGWIAITILLGIGAWALIGEWRDAQAGSRNGDDLGFGLLSATGALAMALAFGAYVTGGFSFGRPDGCYYAHTILVGKSVIQQYDPIACEGRVP